MTKKTKRAICIYIAALLILYIVVQVLPKVTDIFETTETLEPGDLKLSYETKGYFIKDESVCVAPESGDITYLVDVGTAVKKGHPVVSVEAKDSGDKEPRFTEYTDMLQGYAGLSNEYTAPISGIFSLDIDGYEDYFTPENMEKVKRETVEGLTYKSVNLERNSVIRGEPIYKISTDDYWYVLCWVDAHTAQTYSEGGKVTLELPDGSVDATVYKVIKEMDGDYRVIFYLNVYYETFCRSRAADMSIVTSDKEGLVVDNKCIVEKNGVKGVYVKDKNEDYVFTRVKIISESDKQSVIEDATFIDEDGQQVYTVDVYDEVLKHPAGVLEKDLEKDSKEEE